MNKAVIAWTGKLDALVVKMWHERATQDEIAVELGVTKNTIAGRINRLRTRGVDLPRRSGGNPALKQKRIEASRKDNEPRNGNTLHRSIRRAHRKRQDRTASATKAKNTSPPPEPKLTREPYLGDTPEAPDMKHTSVNTHRKKSSTTPTSTLIPEVEGTTCTTLLLDLKSRQCRYVHGMGEDKRFCDGRAKACSSFCELHHAMCYRGRASKEFDKIADSVSP